LHEDLAELGGRSAARQFRQTLGELFLRDEAQSPGRLPQQEVHRSTRGRNSPLEEGTDTLHVEV
jgi:hypothetical protein